MCNFAFEKLSVMKKKPKFKKEQSSGFYTELKKEVRNHLHLRSSKSDYIPGAKMILLGLIYLGSCIYLNTTANSLIEVYLSYMIAGTTMVLLVLNVIHESSHGVLFKNKKLNKLMMLWLELFGTDSELYERRHVTYHHTYPNIENFDAELSQSPVVRVLPQNEFKKHHRYQPFYLPFLYMIFSLNWFLLRDFDDVINNREKLGVNISKIYKLIAQKLAVLVLLVLLPFLNSELPLWVFITGYILCHSCASIVAIIAVACAHVNDDAEFPVPDNNNMMPDTWAEHQLKTTQDFATRNSIINVLFGGFNFHVAHHLFPNVQSKYYSEITPIIQKVAIKYNLHYKHKSMGKAIMSHCRLLLNNSRNIPTPDM
jgi:linoleoyl-CoA desaturase